MLGLIKQTQAEVDEKVAIYYSASTAIPGAAQKDDLWIQSNTGTYLKCKTTYSNNAATSGTIATYWEEVNITIGKVETQYASSTSSTTAPSTGWSTTSPTWESGKYIWQRTVTYKKDNTTVLTTSTAVCISAAAAHAISISGNQIFKETVAGGGIYAP